MEGRKCTHCGGQDLDPGFAEDMGQGSQGYMRWITGRLERGIFGGAKRMGRSRWAVDAYRCRDCAHLELFASNPI
jgi:hypothetical protein